MNAAIIPLIEASHFNASTIASLSGRRTGSGGKKRVARSKSSRAGCQRLGQTLMSTASAIDAGSTGCGLAVSV